MDWTTVQSFLPTKLIYIIYAQFLSCRFSYHTRQYVCCAVGLGGKKKTVPPHFFILSL